MVGRVRGKPPILPRRPTLVTATGARRAGVARAATAKATIGMGAGRAIEGVRVTRRTALEAARASRGAVPVMAGPPVNEFGAGSPPSGRDIDHPCEKRGVSFEIGNRCGASSVGSRSRVC